MECTSTGAKAFDDFLNGGYEKGILTTIYGPAGSGKSTLCLLALVHMDKDKRMIFIDSEGGFSVERIKQLAPDFREVLDRVLILNPVNFDEQKRVFERLTKLVTDKVGLIILDSVAMLYRLEIGKTKNVHEANKDLGVQIAFLTEIARKRHIPILVTNQIYSDFEDREKTSMVGGDILRYGSKCLLEIQTVDDKPGMRRVIVRKHRSIEEGKTFEFKIMNDGIEEVK
jgi:DNA repair protein RadB